MSIITIALHYLQTSEALENTGDGVKARGYSINAVRFADDQAMVANSYAGLQRVIDSLDKTSKDYGIKLKKDKDNED